MAVLLLYWNYKVVKKKVKRMKKLTSAEAKQINMLDYLTALGHHPEKIRNKDYWYLSPLREEKTPSFKVNRSLNAWYDHGIGKGVI